MFPFSLRFEEDREVRYFIKCNITGYFYYPSWPRRSEYAARFRKTAVIVEGLRDAVISGDGDFIVDFKPLTK